MLTKVCDLWAEPADAKCITTNGFIKKNGALVMGAGVAGQAQAACPDLPHKFGEVVQKYGNHVFGLYSPDPFWQDCTLISFPVKHNWFEKADLNLIAQSANELMSLLNKGIGKSFKTVLLPCPGCGNGQLEWRDVKPVIESILDDRIIVVDNGYPSQFDLAI